jgi:hypothetical protein
MGLMFHQGFLLIGGDNMIYAKKLSFILSFWILIFNYLSAEPINIDYPDAKIKKIINDSIDEGRKIMTTDIKPFYNWDKYYEKSFINYDCYNNVHKGKVVYFLNNKGYPKATIAIFIELKNGVPVNWVTSQGKDIEYLLKSNKDSPHIFNHDCY